MIVKDEAPVIAACLASVLPIIDYWIICDTGSSDGTQQIIADFFAEHDKPGELHERPWQDFAHNRTEALALARPHGDYTLIIDADDLLVLPPRFRRPYLTADSYTIEIRHSQRVFFRTQLVRSALPWRYEGVLHEFLSYADPGDGSRVFPETKNQQSLRGIQMHIGEGGARRQSDLASRFARDAGVLRQALATETDSFLVARYTFYLAQSLRDSGDVEAALPVYLKRAELGFWQQEVYFSLYEAARMLVALGRPATEIVAAFWRATAADLRRAEAFHGGARYCREQNRFREGYKFAKAALGLTLPPGALFAEPWIYEYGLLDEFAVNAFWVGDYKGCLTTCRRLLALGRRLPQEYRPRVEANARLAKERLNQPEDVSAPVRVEVVNKEPEVEAETIETAASAAPQLAQSLPTSPDPNQAQPDQPTQATADVQTVAPTRPTNTLHVLGVAHTIPHEDYVVCAFTGKVLAFPDIIQPFGWNVVEYSNEGSASRAREHIPILSRERLRALSLRRSREEPMDADVTNKPLQEEYQRVLVERISARAQPGDIVCHVFGPNMPVFEALPKCHHVEMSVGYTASPGLPFRIYESSAWMHWHHGKAGREDGSNYHWVIPSGFDVDAWPYCAEPGDYAIFLGRVTPRKGISTLVDIARRMPELTILAYGPGDPAQWEADRPPNLHFKGPVFGAERVEAVRRARCMLMPTGYIEPFGFSGIEAQLCGVPLLGTSFGAFQETIIDGVTGYRCHTLADWLAAIRRSPALDRAEIARLAAQRYALEAAGEKYNWAFKQIADLSGPGWYGDTSRKFQTSTSTPRHDGPIPVPSFPAASALTPSCRFPAMTSSAATQPVEQLSMIPKRVMQTFRNAPEPHVKEQLSRFFDQTWTYQHFTDEQILSFFFDNPVEEFPCISDRFHAMPTGAHKADLFRYYYLYVNGGVFIDSDAMIKGDLSEICASCDFFVVRSGWVAGTLFQGFMGTTPGNQIIHAALRDAYMKTTQELSGDYNTFCRELDVIVGQNRERLKIRLFDEILFDNGTAEVFDESGRLMLIHFWGKKAIPKICGSSWVPWNR